MLTSTDVSTARAGGRRSPAQFREQSELGQRFSVSGSAFPVTAHNLVGVAVQEMQHLDDVNQILLAVGASPNLIRQDFPSAAS